MRKRHLTILTTLCLTVYASGASSCSPGGKRCQEQVQRLREPAGLLHWFLGPYVHKLWHDERSGRIKVQMLSIFAQPMCAPAPFT